MLEQFHQISAATFLLNARRSDIIVQFLLEAVVLTGLGGAQGAPVRLAHFILTKNGSSPVVALRH
jgi:ABC-type antimicrobial peptide transport system permease subunit